MIAGVPPPLIGDPGSVIWMPALGPAVMGPAGVRVTNAVVAVPLTWLPSLTATSARLPACTATKCSKVAAATARIALRRYIANLDASASTLRPHWA